MSQPTSATARALAVTALICGFIALLIVVIGSIDGDDGGTEGRPSPARKASSTKAKRQRARTSYVVQNGDTLTSIARKTGVPVARIEALNPGIDPQILVSGQKLKLR
ncbi:MAG TPA: LysM domain-containing protein [Solirubrobacterales bacterium]